MNSTLESLDGNKVKLSITVDEAEFDKELDAAFRRIAKEVRIPGFRPGKAPRRLLEAQLGTGVAREEAMREGLPKFYVDAVREHSVDVIAAPEIDVTGGDEEGPVSFDAVVEVRPIVTVDGYEKLQVTLERPEPTDEELDTQIDRMRELDASLEVVERAAADGDHVTVDIKGTVDGEEQDGLTADDYSYPVGSANIVPELDEQLVGAKAGDILEFEATHPDPDEEGELRFRILVKEVKEKVLPELTDEWADESSDFATVEELRADLAERMATVRRVQADMALNERVGQALADLVVDEISPAMIDGEFQQRLQDLLMRLQAQGMELEQYLMMTGSSQEELVDELRSTAETSARVDLGLRAVALAEKLVSTDEDLDAEILVVAERVGEKPEKVRTQLERNDQMSAVRSDLDKRKALDWLLEHVEIVDPDGNPIDRADLKVEDEDDEINDEATTESE
ncbi:MAG TPA: trigger factor [Acidimicrobiales bacterium]|nr:trigger factor [Acidimicrobiales bacterium]